MQKIINSFFFFFFFWAQLNAQTEYCHYDVNPQEASQLSFLQEQIEIFSKQWLTRKSVSNRSIIYLPIKAHILRPDNGIGGLDSLTISAAIDTLNKHFEATDIQFNLCGNINFINNTKFYGSLDMAITAKPSLSSKFNYPNVINVYFSNIVKNGNTQVLGVATNPFSPNKTIGIKNSAALTNVFAHEMGHFLGLWHTFGKNNSCTVQSELVDGSNCAYAGDDVCDTPASPCLGQSGVLDSMCNYIGSLVDNQGQPYTPLLDNFMDYGPLACRKSFTEGQIARMHYFLDRLYSNLDCVVDYSAYCDVAAESSYKGWIESVKIGDSLSLTNNNGGYYFKQTPLLNIKKGNSYELELVPGHICTYFRVKWRVYLDLNHDHDFLEADELVFDGNNLADFSSTISTRFYVKPQAVSGQTRMRIMMEFIDEHFEGIFFPAPLPCESFKQGEIEDYLVNIEDGIFVDNYCINQPYANLSTIPEIFKISDFDRLLGTQNGYGDFRNDTITFVRGRYYQQYGNWAMYTDFNQNEIFDAGEIFSPPGIFQPFYFPIPLTANLGTTRLRIRRSINSIGVGVCDQLNWDEIIDFTVKIVDEPNTIYPPTQSRNNDKWIDYIEIGRNVIRTGNNGGYQKNTQNKLRINNFNRRYIFPLYLTGIDKAGIKGRIYGGVSGQFFVDTDSDGKFTDVGLSDFRNLSVGQYPIRIIGADEVEDYTLNIVYDTTDVDEDYTDINFCNVNNNDGFGAINKLEINPNDNYLYSRTYSKNEPINFFIGLKPGSKSPNIGKHKFYFWADLNNDLQYDNSTELLYQSDTVNSSFNFVINLPNDCKPGFLNYRILGYLLDSITFNYPDPCVLDNFIPTNPNNPKPFWGVEINQGLFVERFVLQSNHFALNYNNFDYTMPVYTNKAWQVSGIPSWIQIEQKTGLFNDSLNLKFEQNNTPISRTALLTVNNEYGTRTIDIIQYSKPFPFLVDTIYLPQSGGEETIEFISTLNLDIRTKNDWFDLKKTRNGDSYKLTLAYKQNHSPYIRIGHINLMTSDSTTQAITIVQSRTEAPYLYAEEHQINLPNDILGSKKTHVFSNLDWTYTIHANPGWLLFWTNLDTIYVPDETCIGTIFFSFAPNSTDTTRRAYVIVKGGGMTDTIFITQDGVVRTKEIVQTESNTLFCFPNPTTQNQFYVQAPTDHEIRSLEVYSSTGLLLYHTEKPAALEGGKYEINIPQGISGMLIVRAATTDKVMLGKILKCDSR
jgi:hypothetical protein